MKIKYGDVPMGDLFKSGITIYKKVPISTRETNCCEAEYNAIGVNRPAYYKYKDHQIVRTYDGPEQEDNGI